jgi:hypothetical protein
VKQFGFKNKPIEKMKKTLIATACAAALTALTTYGQGTFNFNNYSQNAGLGSPVTVQGTGEYVGADYFASFYYMAGTVTDLGTFMSGATYYGSPVAFFGTTGTGPSHGPLVDGAGIFDGGSPVFGAAGTYTIMVVAWTGGADYASATTRGASSLVQVDLVQNGGTTPLNNLGTLQPFTVSPTVVPEPSTFALAGLGLAGLLIFRRRK